MGAPLMPFDSMLPTLDDAQHMYSAHRTWYYSILSLYILPVSIILNLWMGLVPIASLRDLPARILNWISNKTKLPSFFQVTTVWVMLTAAMLALEYIDMGKQQASHYECKQRGNSLDHCEHTQGLKWRSERNFYMVGIQFCLACLIDALTKNVRSHYEGVSYKANVNTYLEVFSNEVDFHEATASFGMLDGALKAKGLKAYYEFRIKVNTLFDLLDADGNRALSKEELRTVHGSDGQLALFFSKLDADKNKEVSSREFANYFSDLESRKGADAVELMLRHWTATAGKAAGRSCSAPSKKSD